MTQPAYGTILVYQLGEATRSVADLAAALGVATLHDADVQIVEVKTLDDLGMPQFLKMGYGVGADELNNVSASLAAATGHVAIVRAGAFLDGGPTSADHPDAMLIATLHEEGAAPPPLTPLTSDAAQGIVTPPVVKAPKSDARIGGMVATVALLVMFALVGLMIWIAS